MTANLIKKIYPKDKGFTLLFAVLVSSLILAIGLSVANLTIREIQLSGTGRESQFAFYAADTGSECALYWDIKGTNVFATSTESVLPTGEFDCVNENISTGISTTTPGDHIAPAWDDSGSDAPTLPDDSSGPMAPPDGAATTTFEISFEPADPYCAIVKVGKYTDSAGNEHTNIDSRGYNTCEAGSALRTERGLQVTY